MVKKIYVISNVCTGIDYVVVLSEAEYDMLTWFCEHIFEDFVIYSLSDILQITENNDTYGFNC